MSILHRASSSLEQPTYHHVLIIHEVTDFKAWKAVFDSAKDLRRTAGERSYQLLHFPDHPRRIVHFSAWSSHADAKRFFHSEALEEIRRKAGVKAPEFHYLTQLESGRL